jgi:tRNA 5-methylaminomethyl-2-thiouridine biosynthesis bifunctional protein
MRESTPLCLPLANISRTDAGLAVNQDYGDVYHARAGGEAQAEYVFLRGNGLPGRWAERDSFTILETGVGLANNLLKTWLSFRADPKAPQRLHYLAVDRHPVSAAALRDHHRLSPAFASLSETLAARWPPPIRGPHRLELDQGRLIVTLVFGDVHEVLSLRHLAVDAFYLDGFAPTKNPAMWSASLIQGLASVAANGATLATWCVARTVRDALVAAGFTVSKRPGFANKRDMLVGTFSGTGARVRAATRERSVLVLGGGIVGASVAERMACRGWRVDVFDPATDWASAASGNPVALARPLLHADATVAMRLSHQAHQWLYRRALEAAPGLEIAGQLLLAEGIEAERLQQQLKWHGLGQCGVEWLDRQQASERAEISLASGAAAFSNGLTLAPRRLIQGWIDARPRVKWHPGMATQRVERIAGGWCALDIQGRRLGEASTLVIAAGEYTDKLVRQSGYHLPIAMGRLRGQLTFVRVPSGPKVALAGAGYLVPMGDETEAFRDYCLGATFVREPFGLEVSAAEHLENLSHARLLCPTWALTPAHITGGRVAVRSTTPTRIPLLHQLDAGLWVLAGMGARGLTWAPWLAEVLASEVSGDPLPVDAPTLKMLGFAYCLRR